MALPAKRVPETVASLDTEAVVEAIIRCGSHIGNAARVLGVPSADLRKRVLLDQRLQDAAFEVVELDLDDAQANLRQGLKSDDLRLRVDVSKFMLRNTQSAVKRGYAVAASAASLEVSFGKQEPQQIIVSWLGEGEREMETIERDGKTFEVPKYGERRDDCIEGEVTLPAPMIEHAASEPEPEPAPIAAEPVAPEPALLRWTDPFTSPPPLVAHLYQAHTPKPRGGPPQPSQTRKIIYE